MAREPIIDLADLYRRYAPDVNRFVLYLSGDAGVAEDIVSETFVRLWEARDRLELPTVKSYLFAIARNLYLTGRMRARRHTDMTEGLHDPAPRPDVVAEQRSELDRVLRGLQELPEVDRAALVMRAVDAMAYEEIAAALGITEGAAKVKVHRARRKLASARDMED